jgi:hypothetical protein
MLSFSSFLMLINLFTEKKPNNLEFNYEISKLNKKLKKYFTFDNVKNYSHNFANKMKTVDIFFILENTTLLHNYQVEL